MSVLRTKRSFYYFTYNPYYNYIKNRKLRLNNCIFEYEKKYLKKVVP